MRAISLLDNIQLWWPSFFIAHDANNLRLKLSSRNLIISEWRLSAKIFSYNYWSIKLSIIAQVHLPVFGAERELQLLIFWIIDIFNDWFFDIEQFNDVFFEISTFFNYNVCKSAVLGAMDDERPLTELPEIKLFYYKCKAQNIIQSYTSIVRIWGWKRKIGKSGL